MANPNQDKKQARPVGLGVGPLLSGAAMAQHQNQQPDSIPGMFKPGEFVLPPDTVHALGGKAVLQSAVDRTHTPSNAGAMVPLGFKPEMFFAQGGAPEDELRKANSFGDAAGATANPGMQVAQPQSQQTSTSAGVAPLFNAATTASKTGLGVGPLTSAAAKMTDLNLSVPTSAVTKSGNSYSGTNVAGDISINGGKPSGVFVGGVGALLQRSTPQSPAGQLPQPNSPQVPQFNAPQVAHSGNDWEAKNNLRNLEVSASSITNNGGAFDSRRGRINGPSAAQGAFQDAQRADLTARGVQPVLDSAAMQANAGLQRAGMEQQGADFRGGVQALIDQQRNQNDLTRTTMTEAGANQRAVLQTLGGIEEAQVRANAAKAPPTGYRTLPNGSLQAIPGGPADPAAGKEGLQQNRDTQDIFSILDQARPLMDTTTGSYAGAAADQVARTFGVSTEGAQSAAQLKALQGALVSKMPKMSGPQSDKDVLLYREMAGQIGDPTIPVDQRKAAMQTVEDLNMKYLPVASDATAYQALPSGSYFKTPDGSVLRKK